jgi:hypothetical protein
MTLRNSTITFSSVLAMIMLSSPLLAFADPNTIQNGEQLGVKLDKNVYQYGDTIHLTINDMNSASTQSISTFKTDYAGIDEPCGVKYMDFAFLNGDHTNIQSYDDLVAAKINVLNVAQGIPYDAIMCIRGNTDHLNSVTIEGNSNNATVTMTTTQGKTVIEQGQLITSYDISKVYGKTVYNQTAEYKENSVLPAGKYTVVAFTLSGQISKPVLIEVVNTTTTATSFTMPDVVKGLQTVFSTHSGLTSLFAMPALFGGFMALNYKKSGRKFSNFMTAIVMTVIVFSAVAASGQNLAFATYNVGSQGVEEHSTSSTFTNASVQEGFEGVKTDTGTSNGLSVQNNHFVHGFTTGSGYLWVQSFIQHEIPTTATFNSHTCTTQAGSYTCKLPSSVNIRGLTNYWTAQFLGTCPSGWSTSGMSDCVLVPATPAFTSVTLSSSVTRIDLYAYQELQTSGNVYEVQKYRTCTTSCTAYTQLATDTKSYVSTTAYYDLTTHFGGSVYGVESVVGECGICDAGGAGKAKFYDGTYGTEVYTINSSGSPSYRASGSSTAPSEENSSLCWWNTIGNTGGTNPTLTATAQFGTCNS